MTRNLNNSEFILRKTAMPVNSFIKNGKLPVFAVDIFRLPLKNSKDIVD